MSTPPEAPSLTRRFLSTSLINGVQVVATLILRLASNLLLTRLLLPEAFGLMAFALTLQTGVQMLTDLGVERSIVRDKDGDETHYLQAAWTVRMVRSAAVSLILLILALVAIPVGPLLGAADSVLAAPEMPGILAITALMPLVLAAASVNMVTAQRRLQMGRVLVIEVAVQGIGLVMLVGAVYIWPTVWTLAIVTTLIMAVKSLVTHVALPGPKMAFVWDRAIAARLWDYGKWLMGSSTAGFFARNGERLLFAAFIDSTVFGLYSIARIWAEAAQSVVQYVITNAGMSALSEVLRSGRDVDRPFAKLQWAVDGLIIVGSAAYYVLSGPFIRLVYNDNFDPASIYAPPLVLFFLRLRFATFEALLLSAGKTKIVMYATIQIAVVTLVGIWFASMSYGLMPAIVVYGIASMAGVPASLLACKSVLPNRRFALDWAWLAVCLGIGGLLLVEALAQSGGVGLASPSG